MRSAFEMNKETIGDLEVSQQCPPPNNGKGVLNRVETIGIQELEHERRLKLLRNNLILVAFLNFLTVSGLICCLVYYEWFYFEHRIWVGLLYLYEDASHDFYRISHFIDLKCPTLIESPDVCDILANFLLSGRVCTILLSVGLFFHSVFFALIIHLAFKAINDFEKLKLKIVKPLFFKVLSMILYILSLVFWNLYNRTYELKGKIGISMYAGIAGCSIYLLLLIYYGILKKEMKKGKINSYQDPSIS